MEGAFTRGQSTMTSSVLDGNSILLVSSAPDDLRTSLWDNPYLELRAAIPAKWTNRQRQWVDRAIIGAAVWFCFGEVEEHQHFSSGAAAGVTVTRWSPFRDIFAT